MYQADKGLIQDRIQDQVRYLVEQKGMSLKDATDDIEWRLRTKFTEEFKAQINREKAFWK